MLKFLFSKNRKLFLATFLMTLLFATYKPIFSLLILFDSNYIKQEQTLPFYILVCINLGILFSLVLINLGSQIVQQHFFASSLKKMNNQMYQALIRLPLATLIKKYPTEKVVKIMTIDNPFVIKKYLGALISLIYFICSFSLGSLLILTINWHIWLYLLALTLISFFTTKHFVKKIAIHQKKFNDSQANIVQTLQDIFEDLAVLKIFSIGKRLFPRFSQKNKEAEKHFFKNNFFQSTITVINDTCGWFIQIGLLLIGIFLIRQQELTFPELLAITQYVETITTPIFWLSTVLTELYSTKEIRKVNDVLLSTEPELLHSSIVPKTILFNNVLITYEEKNIGPINLELYSGKKYIIIGKNGSGKSSFLKLLTQEINQYQGKILLNQQQELRTVDFSTMIGYVSQKAKLYDGTVAENITSFNKPNKEKLHEIGKKVFGANFEIISNQSTATISGGEAMLVSLARALYENRPFLLVDEPTSSTDKENTEKVLSLLAESSKTVLAVLHHVNNDISSKFDEVIQM